MNLGHCFWAGKKNPGGRQLIVVVRPKRESLLDNDSFESRPKNSVKIRKNAKFEIRVNLCEKICVKNEIASKMFCYHISPLLRVFEVLGKIQKKKRYGSC